jgi:hypothetical protein
MIRYVAFLCAVFEEVNVELDRVDKQDSYESLARSWRMHLETAGNRHRIYGSAIRRAGDFDLVSGCFVDQHFIATHPRPQNAIQDMYRSQFPKAGEVSIENAISKAAQRALVELLTKMASWCNSQDDFTKSKDVRLMLYFDEAHVLAGAPNVQRGRDEKDNYEIMCSCFNGFIGFPFFAIFLSTNSCLSRMARQGSLATFFRGYQNPANLQAPITETPFDCSPKLPLKPGDLMLHDLYKIETLAFFGRPM